MFVCLHAGTSKNCVRGPVNLTGPTAAAGSSTDASGKSRQWTAFCETWSPEVPRIPPKSPGPMPCKCRPGSMRARRRIELGGMRAQVAEAAGSSMDAPGTSRKRTTFGKTGSPGIPGCPRILRGQCRANTVQGNMRALQRIESGDL